MTTQNSRVGWYRSLQREQAVSQNWLALQHASEELRCDREVVIEAISQNGEAPRSDLAAGTF